MPQPLSSKAQDSTQLEDNMRNWIAERIINLGDWIGDLGISLRKFEKYWDFCDANPDCLCDDPTCIEVRNSL